MEKLKEFINRLIFIAGTLFLTILVFTVAWQVISRYVFNSPSIFTDELARFLLMWIGMLGATYALEQRGIYLWITFTLYYLHQQLD